VITATDESLERRTTTIHIAEPLSAAVYPEHAASAGADGDAVMRVLAKPALALHPFGWNADPKLYPPANLKSATATPPANGADGYWYGVSANSYHSKDIYLSEDPANPLVGQYVLRVSGSGRAVFRVTEESSLSLSFNRRTTTTVKIYTAAIASDGSGGFSTSLTPVPVSVPVESHISATVKAIRVNNRGHVTSVDRAEQPLPATWLTGWRQAVPLARREPNPAPVDATFVDVPGMFPLIAPGRTLLFTNKAGTVTQVVAVSRAAVDASANTTRIWWDPIDPTPEAGWFKNDLKIYGNVVRVSHGRTLSEVLGGSDGVEPFQRFPLKQSPVTLMPTASGASPDLEVRVNDIRWQRVDDFASSGPDDRHYRFELDETQTATVVFGACRQEKRDGGLPGRIGNPRRRRRRFPEPDQAGPSLARPRRQPHRRFGRRGTRPRRRCPNPGDSFHPHLRSRGFDRRPRRRGAAVRGGGASRRPLEPRGRHRPDRCDREREGPRGDQ
jgi:hypothetical protein